MMKFRIVSDVIMQAKNYGAVKNAVVLNMGGMDIEERKQKMNRRGGQNG